jgi:hemolysin activation/secretion protein
MPKIKKIFAVAAAAFSVLAAAQQPPDAGSLLQQQAPKEKLPVSPSTAPVLPQVTPPKPALPATTKVNVTVKDFRFTGNTVFPSEVLREQVREFIGKTLDFNGLNDAASRIQRYYRERGYFLAVAYLPLQEIMTASSRSRCWKDAWARSTSRSTRKPNSRSHSRAASLLRT